MMNKNHSPETKPNSRENVIGSNVGKVRNSLNRDKENKDKTRGIFNTEDLEDSCILSRNEKRFLIIERQRLRAYVKEKIEEKRALWGGQYVLFYEELKKDLGIE